MIYLFEFLNYLRNMIYSLNKKTKCCCSLIQHIFVTFLQDKALTLHNLCTLVSKIKKKKKGESRKWHWDMIYNSLSYYIVFSVQSMDQSLGFLSQWVVPSSSHCTSQKPEGQPLLCHHPSQRVSGPVISSPLSPSSTSF